MSEAPRHEIGSLIERARVVGRIADHLVPARPAQPLRVLVQADSPAFAAGFAADIAAAARLRGRQVLVDAAGLDEPIGSGWDEVVRLGDDDPAASIVVGLSEEGRPTLARLGVPGEPVLLFSYGTLQQESVQRSNFGRVLAGRPDTLTAHRSDWVQITDPGVIAASGTDRHPIVRPTGEPSDSVSGTLFEITPAELAAADTYEVDDYRRFRVALMSGAAAWVYLAAEFAASVAE